MVQNLVDDSSWASGQKISNDIDSKSEIWVVLQQWIKGQRSKSQTEVNLYRHSRVNNLANKRARCILLYGIVTIRYLLQLKY